MAQFEIDYDFSALDELKKKFENVSGRTSKKYGERLIEAIEQEAPKKTGALSKSFHVQEEGANRVKVTSDLPYAAHVQYGRGEIVAPPGRTLRFEIGGQVIYAKRVAAVKPNPYLDRGMAKIRSVDDIFQKAMKEAGL